MITVAKGNISEFFFQNEQSSILPDIHFLHYSVSEQELSEMLKTTVHKWNDSAPVLQLTLTLNEIL